MFVIVRRLRDGLRETQTQRDVTMCPCMRMPVDVMSVPVQDVNSHSRDGSAVGVTRLGCLSRQGLRAPTGSGPARPRRPRTRAPTIGRGRRSSRSNLGADRTPADGLAWIERQWSRHDEGAQTGLCGPAAQSYALVTRLQGCVPQIPGNPVVSRGRCGGWAATLPRRARLTSR